MESNTVLMKEKNSSTYIKVDKCRVCGSEQLEPLFSLGKQPLTGVFVKPDAEDPLRAPLDMVICDNCRLVQLHYTVEADLMYKNYWYRSGINQTMRDHLADIAEDVKSRVDLIAGDVFIDIGCNDGTLLNACDIDGLAKIGVDPSDAIKSITSPDITKVNQLFSKYAVEEALNGRKARVITAISMFYDINDPHEFVQNIADILADDGMWVVEMNYTGDMVRYCGYDMISHEHVTYYTMTVFEELLKPHGLYVNDVSLNPINGGSIRIFAGPKPIETDNVKALRKQEKDEGLGDKQTYIQLAERMEQSKQKLNRKIQEILDNGQKIAVYGASTRGNTILLYCGLDNNAIFAAAERNPIKYGLVTAGSRIPIESEERIRGEEPEYMLILPYTFLEEFIDRESQYLDNGGRFLVPVPDIEVISKKNGKIIREVVD